MCIYNRKWKLFSLRLRKVLQPQILFKIILELGINIKSKFIYTMKRFIVLSIIVVYVIFGCTSKNELISPDDSVSQKSFYVKVEQTNSDTKAYLKDGKSVEFEAGDELAVFDQNISRSKYTYSESSFSGTSDKSGSQLNHVHLLFPYSESVEFVDNSLQGTLPAVQKYSESSFFSNSQIMYARVPELNDGSSQYLKNMCGYLMLPLYGTDITVKNIVVSVSGENEYISGDFYISEVDETDDFALIMHSEVQNHENLSNSVTLDCSDVEGGGVQLGNTSEDATVFYISLPPQNYSNGFTVTITDIFGREFIKTAFSTDGYELMRNHIKPMEPLQIVYDAEEELTISKDIDGNYFTVIPTDSPERLLKWAYTVNHFNNSLGFTLQGNITMPAKTIVEDPENKTYIFTDTDITVTDGVPSGSNWVPLRMYETSNNEFFNGVIDGNNFTIEGLIVKANAVAVGFIGWMNNSAVVKNIKFDKAYIHNIYTGNLGETYTGAVAGRSHKGSLVYNVHILNSVVKGTKEVGGIVGRNYRRGGNKYNESIPVINNCTIDANSSISGTGEYVGGICGNNYGALIVNCMNSADVSGSKYVGGIVGMTRSYYNNGANGYLIASCSSDDATIYCLNDSNHSGGIAGCSFLDPSHKQGASDSYIVGCYSNSTLIGGKKGTIIGSNNTGTTVEIISSWAEKKDDSDIIYGENSDITLTETNHYKSSTDFTQDIIDKMNDKISEYNGKVWDVQGDVVKELIKCHYKWQYNENGWPTLVKDESVN